VENDGGRGVRVGVAGAAEDEEGLEEVGGLEGE
jgi:hypothetical protein